MKEKFELEPPKISEIELPGTIEDATEKLSLVEFDFRLATQSLPNPNPSEIHLWMEVGAPRTMTVPSLLARYGGFAELDLASRLTRNPKGKPELTGSEIRFNLSTTEGVTMAAVTFQRKIGVDIEAYREMDRWEEIAKKYFGQEDALMLAALSPPERIPKFMEKWTLVEAWIKAQGAGIFDRPAQLLPDAQNWRAFRVELGHATGAIVIER